MRRECARVSVCLSVSALARCPRMFKACRVSPSSPLGHTEGSPGGCETRGEEKKRTKKETKGKEFLSLFASTCLSLSLLCLPPPFSFMMCAVTVDQCVVTCFYPSLFCCHLLNRLLYFPFFGTTETVMHLMISPFNQILFCRR